MNIVSKIILPLVAIGALATHASSAEPAPAATAPATAPDVATAYTTLAAAKVKAEVAVATLAQAVDGRTNGARENREKTEAMRQKVVELYDKAKAHEETKGDMRDQTMIASFSATRTSLDTQWNEANLERQAIEQKLNMAGDQFGALRGVYSSTENLERSMKEARLDLSPAELIYGQIVSKANSAESTVKEALAANAALSKKWTALVDDAKKILVHQ